MDTILHDALIAAADALVALHFATILFEVIGEILVFAGRSRWPWVRNVWFRSVHLGVIVTVTFESWFGLPCPYTVWEQWLREHAGQRIDHGEFVAHWTRQLLGVGAPPVLLALVYTAFCAVVVWTWWKVPPEVRVDLPRAAGRSTRAG